MAPMRKIDFNHFPLCVKVFFTFLKNCLNGIGSSLDLGVLTRKKTKIVEIKQKTGIKKMEETK
jgi:hypothetical protein